MYWIYHSLLSFNQHTGCHKAPSYGFPGEQGGYCYSHKTPSMTYLKVIGLSCLKWGSGAAEPYNSGNDDSQIPFCHALFHIYDCCYCPYLHTIARENLREGSNLALQLFRD